MTLTGIATVTTMIMCGSSVSTLSGLFKDKKPIRYDQHVSDISIDFVTRFMSRFYLPVVLDERNWVAYSMALVGFLDDLGFIPISFLTPVQSALVAFDVIFARRRSPQSPKEPVLAHAGETDTIKTKVSNLLAVLVTALSVSFKIGQTSCKEPIMVWVNKIVNAVLYASRSTAGLLVFFSLILDFVIWVVEWLIGKFQRTTLLQTIHTSHGHFLNSWMAEVQELTHSENIRERAGDLDYLVRVDVANRIGEHIMRDLAVMGKSNHALGLLCKNILDARNTCVSSQIKRSFRREPYVIWISGAGGIGKSQYATHLVYELFKAANITVSGNPVYVFQNQSKHWTGVEGKKAIVFDDFLINCSSESADQMIEVLQRLKSCALFIPEMAHLEAKGHPLEPEVVVILSNFDYPTGLTINEEHAFDRRVDSRIRVRAKRDVPRTESGVVNIEGEGIGKFDHLEFEFLPILSTERHSGRVTLSQDMLEAALREQFVEFVAKQKAIYDVKLNELMSLLTHNSTESSLAEAYNSIVAESTALFTSISGGRIAAWKHKVSTLVSDAYGSVQSIFGQVRVALGIPEEGVVVAEDDDTENLVQPVEVHECTLGMYYTYTVPPSQYLKRVHETCKVADVDLKRFVQDYGIFSKMMPFKADVVIPAYIDPVLTCVHEAITPKLSCRSVFIPIDVIAAEYKTSSKHFSIKYINNLRVAAGLNQIQGKMGVQFMHNACRIDVDMCEVETSGYCDGYCVLKNFDVESFVDEEADITQLPAITEKKIPALVTTLKETAAKVRAIFFKPGTWEPTLATQILVPVFTVAALTAYIDRQDSKSNTEIEERRCLIQRLKNERTLQETSLEVPLPDPTEPQAPVVVYDQDLKRYGTQRMQRAVKKAEKSAVKTFGRSSVAQGLINTNIPIMLQKQYRYLVWDGNKIPVFGLCGRTYLTLRHFTLQFKRHASVVSICQRDLSTVWVGRKEDLEFSNSEGTEIELITILNSRCPQVKCVVSHFVEDKHIAALPTSCTILNVQYLETTLLTEVSTHFDDEIAVETHEGTITSVVDTTITYNWGYPGACLSAVFMDVPNTKLVGFHIAGRKNSSKGVAELVARESFQDFCCCLKPEPERAIAEAECGQALFVRTCEYTYQPPTKTTIGPSCLQDDFEETKTIPAPLSEQDVKGLFDPYREGVKFHWGSPPHFDADVLEEIYLELKDVILQRTPPLFGKDVNPLSDEVVVNGAPGCVEMPPLVLNTAEGYPYMFERPTGVAPNKSWLIEREPLWIHERVQNIRREKLAMRVGRTMPETIFVDCLKDSRIKTTKYFKPGSTRVFSISPVDYLLDFRQYCGHFFSAFQRARFTVGHAIGINPDSTDWTDLYKHITRNNRLTKFLCGDYAKFGPTLAPSVLRVCKQLVIHWYKTHGATEEHINIIDSLFEELICSKHLYRDVVYQTMMGSPSGAPPTALLNSLSNLIYIVYVWKKVFAKSRTGRSFASFESKVSTITYGDDIVLGVEDDVLQQFNNEVLQDQFRICGISYTDATKGERIIKYSKIDQVTFLKRSFAPHPRRANLWLAPLEEDSIEECVKWVHVKKSGASVIEATADNVLTALRLAFGHGPDYYSRLKSRLVSMAVKRAVKIDMTRAYDWDVLDELIFDSQNVPDLWLNTFDLDLW